MYMFISMSNKKMFRRAMSLVLVVVFICVNVNPTYADNGLIASIPEVIPVSVVDVPYTPAIMTGMTIYPEDLLKFDFIIDSGDEELNGEEFKKESERLINYFMASLTVPDDEMWVNLSPYEEDRIIAEGLGGTELGKDMLGQDYMLKNLTGSLLSPKEDVGREFWERLYKKVEEKLGTRDVPLKTFNKIWIVPESANVYVKGNNVFIVGSRLKVMLEQDYLALEHHSEGLEGKGISDSMTEETVRILREIVVPEIEREVNEGKQFSKLRQMYHAMILANWYKRRYSGGRLSEEYVGKNNVLGIELKDKKMKENIYVEYMKAFEEGAYDEVVEVYDPDSQEIVVNNYFSGGLDYSSLDNIVEEVDKGVFSRLLKRIFYKVPVKVEGINPEYKEFGDMEVLNNKKYSKTFPWIGTIICFIIIFAMDYYLYGDSVFFDYVKFETLNKESSKKYSIYVLGSKHGVKQIEEIKKRIIYLSYLYENIFVGLEGLTSSNSTLYSIDYNNVFIRLLSILNYVSNMNDKDKENVDYLYKNVGNNLSYDIADSSFRHMCKLLADNLYFNRDIWDITSFSQEERNLYNIIINNKHNDNEIIKELIKDKKMKTVISIIKKFLQQEMKRIPDEDKEYFNFSKIDEFIKNPTNKQVNNYIDEEIVIGVRDKIMANRIIDIMGENPNNDMFVFVGSKHVNGITQELRISFGEEVNRNDKLDISKFKKQLDQYEIQLIRNGSLLKNIQIPQEIEERVKIFKTMNKALINLRRMHEELIKNKKDNSSIFKNKNGGIDFNPNNMTISETGDKSSVRSVVKDGVPNNTYTVTNCVTAVISNITPITNLPQLLGL